ncbi:hypothetical protein [Kineococcus sp. SYSU DK003]|uniref:hypothetical protein n=1 Tax=Kineococcus sp. SYSU DK003 TaxID=3383124 RepID=UPI003D7D8D4E
MRITAEQAAARVRAGLGREPQDALEASVVLEAWGGLTARTALPLATSVAANRRPGQDERSSRRARGDVSEESTREVLGLIATLLATTLWVAPLAQAFGTDRTAQAWQLALPVSLGLQWFLRRRYLTDPHGLGRMRADRPVVLGAGAFSAATTLGMVADPALVLPAALVVTWVGGLLVVVRGWGVPYAVALLAATGALQLGVPVRLDVLLVLVLTQLAVGFALVTSAVSTRPPTSWPRSLAAGLIGGTTALLIVFDPTVEWSSWRPFPVVALIPSLLGTVWASRHLNRIWTVLLDALASTHFGDRRSSRRSRRVFGGIIAGAFGRLVLMTAVVSVGVFLLVQPGATSGSSVVLLLLGLGCFGIVSFLAALLESFSRLLSAGAVVAVAVLVSLATVAGLLPWPGPPLLAAAVAALVAAVVPVGRLVSQPDRTLATMF